ncbi:MAG: ATP-binding protein [Caldisphaeraceae archaeon]|nr:ATP-binding protein [Caldisphaeraceae archaeon]
MTNRKEILHPIISDYINKRLFIVVYGPPRTGKTHLAFSIARYLLSNNIKAGIIATEASTFTFARNVEHNTEVYLCITKEQLVKKVIDFIIENRYIVLDSINWLFRSFNDETSQKELSFISSLMGTYGGFATGQVSEIEDTYKMSMDSWILPWANVIGAAKKLNNNLVELKIERPKEVIMKYKITRDGVDWI